MPPALAFRLETAPGSPAAHVVWDGESAWSAADLLRHPQDRPHAWSALAEAREWLRAALADGPHPAHEILRESRSAGITRSTLYAAKRAENIRAHKEHVLDGRWLRSPPPTPRAP